MNLILQKSFVGLFFVVCLTACLSACKEKKVELSCNETVPTTERLGFKVRQTLNGLYIKDEDIGQMSCATFSPEEALHGYRRISSFHNYYYWRDGNLVRLNALQSSSSGASRKDSSKPPMITLFISFTSNPSAMNKSPSWWYSPAIPHRHYPIDLLPNFGLDMPDADAGVGPVRSKPTVYWAVRGTRDQRNELPFTTYCSIRPPPGNSTGDVSYERDPRWLVEGETYLEQKVGNTCRGGILSSNGLIGAQVDVPGIALPEIDKIYQAVSEKLSQITVE